MPTTACPSHPMTARPRRTHSTPRHREAQATAAGPAPGPPAADTIGDVEARHDAGNGSGGEGDTPGPSPSTAGGGGSRDGSGKSGGGDRDARSGEGGGPPAQDRPVGEASDDDQIGDLVLRASAGDDAAAARLQTIYRPRVDEAMRRDTGSPTTAGALTAAIFAQAFAAPRADTQHTGKNPQHEFETQLKQAAISSMRGWRAQVKGNIVAAAGNAWGLLHPDIGDDLEQVSPKDVVAAIDQIPARAQADVARRLFDPHSQRATANDRRQAARIVEMLADLTRRDPKLRDPMLRGRTLADAAGDALTGEEVQRRLDDAAAVRRSYVQERMARSALDLLTRGLKAWGLTDTQIDEALDQAYPPAGTAAARPHLLDDIGTLPERQQDYLARYGPGVTDSEIARCLGFSSRAGAQSLKDRAAKELETLRRARQALTQSSLSQAELLVWQETVLTEREQQVTALHQAGWSLTDIGRQIGITRGGAEKIFKKARQKLVDRAVPPEHAASGATASQSNDASDSLDAHQPADEVRQPSAELDPEPAAQVEGRCFQESIGNINSSYADQRKEGDPAVAEVRVEARTGSVGTMMMSLAANGHLEFRGTGTAGLRTVAELLSDPDRGPPAGNGMWVLESPTDARGRPVGPGHAYFVHCESVDEQGKAILRTMDRTKGINDEFDPTKINQRTNVHGILFDPNGNTVAGLYDKRPEFDGEGNWINALDLELVPYMPELKRDDVQAHRPADTAAGSGNPTEQFVGGAPDNPRSDRQLSARRALDRLGVSSAKELVAPLGDVDGAAALASAKASAMAGLSPDEIDALVEEYPHTMGNAVCGHEQVNDKANRLVLQRVVDRARHQLSRLYHGGRLTGAKREAARRALRIEGAKLQVDLDVKRAGMHPPRWDALHPNAFGHHGLAVIVIGDDHYRAETVSLHYATVPIDKIGGTLIRPALDQQRLNKEETGSAAALILVGPSRAAFDSYLAGLQAARRALGAPPAENDGVLGGAQDKYSLRIVPKGESGQISDTGSAPTRGSAATDGLSELGNRWREDTARKREFDGALKRARASGEPEVRMLESSHQRQVLLQTFPNGFQMQVESYGGTINGRDAALDAVVMFCCAQAVGAPIGRPFQLTSTDSVVRREYQPAPAPDSPEGKRFGLYEVLAGRDGLHAQYFRDAATGAWKDHELPLSEIFRIRREVAVWAHEFRIGARRRIRRVLRDLAEIERHAVHTPAERRARDGLTVDAREKFGLLEEMRRQDYPKLVGFDHPYVPADAVKQVKRALDDFMGEHGERARLDRVTLDFLPGRMNFQGPAYAETYPPDRDTAEGSTIALDLGWVADPHRMQSSMSRDLRMGLHPRGTGRPVYDAMMQEFGHVMDDSAPNHVVDTLQSGSVVSATGEKIWTHLEDVLREVHFQLVEHGKIGGDDKHYDVWIRRLPSAAFDDGGKTVFNAEEAIGVGVEAVQINRGMVGWPQWVIHHYTTTGRIPVVTDDLEVHLPPAPAQPEQFRLPDWQATRQVLQHMYGDIADHPALRGEDVSPAELASTFPDFGRVDDDRVTPEALGRYLLNSPAGTTLLIADVQYSGDGYSFDDGWLTLATHRGGHISDPRTGQVLAGAEIARQPGMIRYIVALKPDGTPCNPIPELPDAPDPGDKNRSNRSAANEDSPTSSAAAMEDRAAQPPPRPPNRTPTATEDTATNDPGFLRQLADQALRMRSPQAPAEALANPLGSAVRAIPIAVANARLAKRLSLDEPGLSRKDVERRRALIGALKKTYPKEFGKSEGFGLEDRDEVIRDLAVAEGFQGPVRDFDEAVAEFGLGRPLWLALDRHECSGDGLLLLAVGEHPFKAKKRAWLFARQPIDQVGDLRRPAFKLLQSIRRQEPAATVMLCVGNTTASSEGLAGQAEWVKQIRRFLDPVTTPVPVAVRGMLGQEHKFGAPGSPERPVRVLLENLFGEPGQSDPRNAFYSRLAAFQAACQVWQTGAAEDRVYALRSPSSAAGWQKELLKIVGLPLVEPTVHGAKPARANPLWRQDMGVSGHRGDSNFYPELSGSAIQSALDKGADAIEIDVRLSKDGYVVLLHDPTVGRTSAGSGMVINMTLAELKALYGEDGLLTLDEAVQLVKDHHAVSGHAATLFVEIKAGGLEGKVVEILERAGLANPASADQPRAVVTSFFPHYLLAARRAAQELQTTMSMVWNVLPLASEPQIRTTLAMANWIGVDGLAHYAQTLQAFPDAVGWAAAEGLVSIAGPADNDTDRLYLRALGVHWLMTDDPAGSRDLLEHGPADSDTQAPTGESPSPTTAPVTAAAEPQGYASYEEFGREFFNRAVSAQAVAKAVASMAGGHIEIGPITQGPGNVATISATGDVGQPRVVRTLGDTNTFDIVIPLRIDLTVGLPIGAPKFEVTGGVRLRAEARAQEPLLVVIDIDEAVIDVQVQPMSRLGKALRTLAGLDAQIQTFIADYVREKIAGAQAARVINVAERLGLDSTADSDTQAPTGESPSPTTAPVTAAAEPQGYASYEEFGREFFNRAVSAQAVAKAVASMAGGHIEIGPITQGPGNVATISATGDVGQPRGRADAR